MIISNTALYTAGPKEQEAFKKQQLEDSPFLPARKVKKITHNGSNLNRFLRYINTEIISSAEAGRTQVTIDLSVMRDNPLGIEDIIYFLQVSGYLVKTRREDGHYLIISWV